jgi:hypothetical protein
MKCYSPEFNVTPTGVFPSKAVQWDSLKKCIDSYREFIKDCDKFGQNPVPLFIFNGEAEGNEEQYGYPDWPNYIVRVGPRGGIIKEPF